MIIVSSSNYISVTIFFGLSLGHIFNEMCEVTKGAWPSDIAKEILTLTQMYMYTVLLNYHYIIRYLDGTPGITGYS